jgi:hypothetical protein
VAISSNVDVGLKAGQAIFDAHLPVFSQQPFGQSVFELGDDPHGPVIAIAVMPPNVIAAPHYHDSDQCVVILEGAMKVGKTWCGPGVIRFQEDGSSYGPIETGPEGCLMIQFMADRTAMPDQFKSQAHLDRFNELAPDIFMKYMEAGLIPNPDGLSIDEVYAQLYGRPSRIVTQETGGSDAPGASAAPA